MFFYRFVRKTLYSPDEKVIGPSEEDYPDRESFLRARLKHEKKRLNELEKLLRENTGWNPDRLDDLQAYYRKVRAIEEELRSLEE
jgi:hypothetical protein